MPLSFPDKFGIKYTKPASPQLGQSPRKINCPCGECSWIGESKPDPDDYPPINQGEIARGGVLLITKDKVLMVQTRYGYLGFPKGRANEGEHLSDTAIREMFEETGVYIPKRMLTVHNTFYDGVRYYVVQVDSTYPLTLTATEDVIGAGWINMKCVRHMQRLIPDSKLTMFVRRLIRFSVSKFFLLYQKGMHVNDDLLRVDTEHTRWVDGRRPIEVEK